MRNRVAWSKVRHSFSANNALKISKIEEMTFYSSYSSEKLFDDIKCRQQIIWFVAFFFFFNAKKVVVRTHVLWNVVMIWNIMFDKTSVPTETGDGNEKNSIFFSTFNSLRNRMFWYFVSFKFYGWDSKSGMTNMWVYTDSKHMCIYIYIFDVHFSLLSSQQP